MSLDKKMISVILGVVIAGIMLGYVFPVGLNSLNEDPTYNLTQEDNTQYQVQESLNSTVTSSSSGTSATIQLTDTTTGATETQTINVGESAEFNSLDGGYVNVTVDSVVDTGTANETTADYQVEQGFGWSGGAQNIFGVLGIMLVLVPLIALAKSAMNA